MEKYCTIAIFVWLGLPFLAQCSIILESDASLNVKNNEGISAVFGNQKDFRDYASANPINIDFHDSLNIEDESNDREAEVDSPGVGYRDDSQDYPLSSQFSTDSYESRKSIDYRDYPLEYLIDGGGDDIVESDPVMEEIPKDIEWIYQMNKKRHVPDRGFTEETKKLMLDLHNVYRGNVTPPAADMNFLEWDENLEHLAQLWADNCVFAHGRPPNTKYIFEEKIYPYGQNLYIGTDPSGYKGLWMWYEEYMHYELRNQTCKPDEQCGHYVQMAWAESKRLGCGIKLCGMRYLIVCHYYPGAIKGSQMFLVGRPCSLCNEEDGALCKDKLCMSHELCRRRPKICESASCKLKCHNCGRLNKTSCQCTCADGWDSPDCSKLCEDEHVRCGVRPGFPNKAACSINNYSVAKKYCRKMCDKCAPVANDTTTNYLCCDGSLCQKGYVLDLERKPCRCTQLCPGPLCDFVDDESPALKCNFIHLISQILVLYFMIKTNDSL